MASSLVGSSSFTKAVCNAMKRIAPPSLAASWDNTGLVMESPVKNDSANVNRVLLTIDITPAVCDEAIAFGASMIVSYHTPIFRGLKSLTLATPLEKTLLRCTAGGISIYTPHSALDSVFGGINDWLAGCLGAAAPHMISVLGSKPATEAIGGDGRCVTFEPPVSMDVLEGRIKRSLGLTQIQVGYSPLRSDRLVRTVAICAGSGGSMFSELATKADVYFTGEMQHHEVLAAVSSGTHVILCGHTNTERGYLPTLAKKLRSELEHEAQAAPDTGLETFDVHISYTDAHPLHIV